MAGAAELVTAAKKVSQMTEAFNEYLLCIQFGPLVLRVVPVLAIDLDDAEMKIVFSSLILDDLFGYGPGELRGQSLEMVLPDDKKLIHREHFQNYRKAPADRTMNAGVWVNGKKKDGTLIKVQVSLSTCEIGGQTFVVAHICDVTKAYYHIDPMAKPQEPAKSAG